MDQPMIVIVAGVLAVAVVQWPLKWALGLVVATTFQPLLIGGLDVNTILLVILMLRIVRSGSQRQLLFSSRFLQAFGLFVAWSLLSILWAENRAFGFDVAKAYIRMLLIMAAAVVILREDSDLVGAIWGVVVGIVYVAASLLLNELGAQTLVKEVGVTERLTIEGASVNALSTQVAWGVTLVIYYVLKIQCRRYRGEMAAAGLLLVLCWGSAFVTGSRGAMVCLVVGPGLVVLSSRLRASMTVLGIAAVIYSGVVLWTVILTPAAADVSGPLVVDLPLARGDTNARVERLLAGEDDTGREKIWQVGLLIGWARPVTGAGLGNAKEFYPLYSSQIWVDPYWPTKRTLHNSYVTVFSEGGLVGMVLFVYFLVTWLGSQPRRSPHLGLLVVFGALLLITGMTSNFLQTPLLMFLLACVHQISQFAPTLPPVPGSVVSASRRRSRPGQRPGEHAL